MSNLEKARENRLRKALRRQGFILTKSRSYIPPDIYDGYRILDGFSGSVVNGWNWELDLDAVEEFVSSNQ